MEMTEDGIAALAPDASALEAGRKQAKPGVWKGLGRSEAALWGECQGSALYQVRVDLSDLTTKCSCPSHKFPCKHGLGLLFLAVDSPDTLPRAEPPAWVSEWLTKRVAAQQAREAPKPSDTQAPKKSEAALAARADKRMALVTKGLEGLDLWLNDLVRNGLAGLELQPATFWERQAARMVDAQAPGVAARLRRMAEIPNATPDWPARLLSALGRLALLTEAFHRLSELDPALQDDVRQAVGWTLEQDEVQARGEAVEDEWLVLGQYVVPEDKLRVQRTWLRSLTTGREALVLQFAFGKAPFAQTVVCGVRQAARLVYWPGAYPQRALIDARRGAATALRDRLPGCDRLEDALRGTATALARQPWTDRFGYTLREVVPVRDAAHGWSVVDSAGAALPLIKGEHWRLLALSGGAPVDLAAEWDGESLRPLGAMADGEYHLLTSGGLE